MTIAQINEPILRKPLRLWPGVVIVALQWLIRFVLPAVVPEAMPVAVIGGLVGGVAIVVWWLFFSRAPWPERLGTVAIMIIAFLITSRLVHESIATGAMGMLFPIMVIPILSLAFVGWVVLSNRFPSLPRYPSMVAAIVLACGVLTLIKTGGFTGDFKNDLRWRWAETPEERLLTQAGDELVAPARSEPVLLSSAPAAVVTQEEQLVAKANDKRFDSAPGGPAAPATAKAEAYWPGFRGPARDGIIHGVRIGTDWSSSPPVELWRRPIGPGWSSFAVGGDLLYTQEQRGDDEIVACYKVSTGEPVWMHRDAARFWESNAGAGPRGTPTISNDRVYTFGATGILNALDANNGAVVWSRNAATDTKAKLPMWGFSSSPMVVDDLVIVATSGALIAYDAAAGAQRWSHPDSSASYSSPHLLTIDGVEQIVQVNGDGVTGVTPSGGALLWKHAWPGYPIVQPTLTADGDILISVNAESGTRRLAVANGPGGWTVEERWTSKGLKPYYSDIVVHHGHAFGFDGSILSCIDVADGKRKWKGGRYGAGQLFLLADQDLLFVLSEQGELALVNAASDKFTELARFQAIEGKTWNHPVLIGDILLVRNGQEMVAFRLSTTVG